MNSINITDIKSFMSKLLIKEDFDFFLVEEASITTFNTFNIDGHIIKSYYEPNELEELQDTSLSSWGAIKHICFFLIKGKRTPSRFKFVFKANADIVSKIISSEALSFNENDIAGLYLNIKYENNSLNCITAISMNTFTMDKTIEKAWDKYIETLLNNIC